VPPEAPGAGRPVPSGPVELVQTLGQLLANLVEPGLLLVRDLRPVRFSQVEPQAGVEAPGLEFQPQLLARDRVHGRVVGDPQLVEQQLGHEDGGLVGRVEEPAGDDAPAQPLVVPADGSGIGPVGLLAEERPAVQTDGGHHRLDVIHAAQEAEAVPGELDAWAAGVEVDAPVHQGLAEALAAGVAQAAADFQLLGGEVALAPLPSRMHVDLPQPAAPARLPRDRLLDSVVDREAGGQDEAAEDHSQGGEQGAHFLLPQGGQRQAQDIGNTHRDLLRGGRETRCLSPAENLRMADEAGSAFRVSIRKSGECWAFCATPARPRRGPREIRPAAASGRETKSREGTRTALEG
jgi:hypothetical protein